MQNWTTHLSWSQLSPACGDGSGVIYDTPTYVFSYGQKRAVDAYIGARFVPRIPLAPKMMPVGLRPKRQANATLYHAKPISFGSTLSRMLPPGHPHSSNPPGVLEFPGKYAWEGALDIEQGSHRSQTQGASDIHGQKTDAGAKVLVENRHFRRFTKPQSNPYFWTPEASPAATPRPDAMPTHHQSLAPLPAARSVHSEYQSAPRAQVSYAFAHSRQATPHSARARRGGSNDNPLQVAFTPVSVRLLTPRKVSGWQSLPDEQGPPGFQSFWPDAHGGSRNTSRGEQRIKTGSGRRENAVVTPSRSPEMQELMKLKDLLEVTIVGDRIERPAGSSESQRTKSAHSGQRLHKSRVSQERERFSSRGSNQTTL